MSSSINDRTKYLEGLIKQNPADAITKVIQKMERIGVTVAGIPCNTAHSDGIFDIVVEQLQIAKSSVKLLNMILETVSFISGNHPQIKRVGVLSTTGTYKSGVYSKILKSKGYEVIVPTLEIQEKFIHPAIYDLAYGIKSFSNPIKQQAIDNLYKGISYFKAKGTEAVILGCTEIPLAIPEKEVDGLVTIDPTNVLARALIKNYYPNKLKEL